MVLAFLDWISDVAWAGLIWWMAKNVPGLILLLVGFGGLVLAMLRHQSSKSGFRLSPRYFRDWLIVIFGATLCTVGLLLLVGVVEPG